MASDQNNLEDLAERVRRTLHDVSEKTSIVHVNVAFLVEHAARHLAPEYREALQDADVAATGLVELVRDLQRLVQRAVG